MGLVQDTGRQILIAGYYGFGNLGDEAMLRVLIRLLRKAFPEVEPVVLSQDPRSTSHAYGVKSINRWNLWQIRGFLKRSRLLVLGGGSLLQDATSQRSLLYYLGLIEWAQRWRKPVFMLGQGIGPLERKSSRSLASAVLAGVEAMLVRDAESHQQLISMGLSQGRIIHGEDLAILLESSKPSNAEGVRRRGYFCAVPKDGLSQAQICSLASNFDKINLRLGVRTLLVPFFKRRDWPTSQAVARAMKTPVEVVTATGLDFQEVAEIISESELLIGMRLHSLILALNAHVPFAAINYDPKIERFVRRVSAVSGFRFPLWDLANLEGLVAEIEQLHMTRNMARLKLEQAHEHLIQLAGEGCAKIFALMKPYLEEAST